MLPVRQVEIQFSFYNNGILWLEYPEMFK